MLLDRGATFREGVSAALRALHKEELAGGTTGKAMQDRYAYRVAACNCLDWGLLMLGPTILADIFEQTKTQTCSTIANPSALYRGQKPPNQENRVSESKNPISTHPRKGVSSQKIPIFPAVPCIEMGIFDSRRPFLGWGEMVFFCALFLILGFLAPVQADGFATLPS